MDQFIDQSPINKPTSIIDPSKNSAFTPIKLPNINNNVNNMTAAPQANVSATGDDVSMDFMQLLMTMGVFTPADLLQLSMITAAQSQKQSINQSSTPSIIPTNMVSPPKINNQMSTIVKSPSTTTSLISPRIVKCKSPQKSIHHPSPRKQPKLSPANNLANLTKEISEKAAKREAAAELSRTQNSIADCDLSDEGDDISVGDGQSECYVINPATGNKVRRNYKNMTRARRVEANARERSRVHTIGSAFDSLRAIVPALSGEQKLSKLSILRIACAYIMLLGVLNEKDYSEGQQGYTVEQCMDMLNETIANESKALKKEDTPTKQKSKSPAKKEKLQE